MTGPFCGYCGHKEHGRRTCPEVSQLWPEVFDGGLYGCACEGPPSGEPRLGADTRRRRGERLAALILGGLVVAAAAVFVLAIFAGEWLARKMALLINFVPLLGELPGLALTLIGLLVTAGILLVLLFLK